MLRWNRRLIGFVVSSAELAMRQPSSGRGPGVITDASTSDGGTRGPRSRQSMPRPSMTDRRR